MQGGTRKHEKEHHKRPLYMLDLVKRPVMMLGQIYNNCSSNHSGQKERHLQPVRQSGAQKHKAERFCLHRLARLKATCEKRRGKSDCGPYCSGAAKLPHTLTNYINTTIADDGLCHDEKKAEGDKPPSVVHGDDPE